MFGIDEASANHYTRGSRKGCGKEEGKVTIMDINIPKVETAEIPEQVRTTKPSPWTPHIEDLAKKFDEKEGRNLKAITAVVDNEKIAKVSKSQIQDLAGKLTPPRSARVKIDAVEGDAEKRRLTVWLVTRITRPRKANG